MSVYYWFLYFGCTNKESVRYQRSVSSSYSFSYCLSYRAKTLNADT